MLKVRQEAKEAFNYTIAKEHNLDKLFEELQDPYKVYPFKYYYAKVRRKASSYFSPILQRNG